MHAILFLAPISVFDERLAEDRKVNRLQDTFALWEAIAKSDLLKACTLIRELVSFCRRECGACLTRFRSVYEQVRSPETEAAEGRAREEVPAELRGPRERLPHVFSM